MASSGMNLASMFQVDYLGGVDENDFSSRVEESFNSLLPIPEYDREANSFHDDLGEACRREDLSAVMEGLLHSSVGLHDQLKNLAKVAAAGNDSDEIMTYLIQISKSISEANDLFDSAAFTATYCGNLQILGCLLDLGAVSDNAADPSTGDTCLHIAAARNHRHVVEDLCSRNPKLAKGKNEAGQNPLHVPVLNGHLELVQYFITKGLYSPMLVHLPSSSVRDGERECGREESSLEGGAYPMACSIRTFTKYFAGSQDLSSSFNPPMLLTKGGNTALHCACQTNQEKIAEFLITQVTPDLLQTKNEKGFLSIHFAAANGNLQLVSMLTDHMERCNISCNSKGDSSWTPLHCAAEAGHLEVVKYFCSHHKFNPEACTTGRNGLSPLHSAALHGKRPILEYLLSSNKFLPDALCQIFLLSNAFHLAAYQGHTSCCQLLIDEYNLNPSDYTGSGVTAIYLAAASGHSEVVSWLLSTGKCDPNQPTQMTKATPLHLAASFGDLECVRALTAHKSCNPNAKTILRVTPFSCAANEAICWELIKRGATPTNRPDILDRYQFLHFWAPILPSVRIFVVGASGAGKSTLVKSMQLEHKWILGRFFSVKGVEQHTAGVIPVNFESSKLGQVTIYDFGGHEEYYSGHEAFLDKASHSLSIFLLVVDLQQEEVEVKRQISYWRKFIEQATHLSSSGKQSKIVIVGSHFDCLRTSEKNLKKDTLRAECEDEDGICWVTINCRMAASGSMTEMRNILHELCTEAKSSIPDVLPCAYAFAAFLKHTFTTDNEVLPACQLHEIKGKINGPLARDFEEELEQLLWNLSDVGSILYLPDHKKPDDGWIIFNQEPILHGIHGYQKRVKQMQLDTASGVLSFQVLKELFDIPSCNSDMVIRYLVHMEFCHEIDNQEILRALTKRDQQLDSRHFLFPDLIKTSVQEGMWQEGETFTCYSGFAFRCRSPEDFITPRLFHVVLLRIAFTFAAHNSDAPLQDCSLWKNGIHWVKIGIETIIELTEGGRTLLVMCRSGERNKMDLIKHRAALLDKVREVLKEFPAVSLDKLIIHPQDLHPPYPIVLSDKKTRFFEVQSILQALKNAENPDHQHVCRAVLEREVVAFQCHIDDLLLSEPYSLIRGNQLETVINMQHQGPVEDLWFLENIAKYSMNRWQSAAKFFGIGEEVFHRVQLKCQAADSSFMDIFKEWVKTFRNRPTFKDLREQFDQYSIFRGEKMEMSIEIHTGATVKSSFKKNPPSISAPPQLSPPYDQIHERLAIEEASLTQALKQKKQQTQKGDVGVQFNFLVPMSEHLRGVHVASEKLFHISGKDRQQLEWEEYGFRMQVPEGATSGPCDFAVKAIIAGQFEFPENTELVSAVYAISASRRLKKLVTLEIEHCVEIKNDRHSEYLSFGIARCNQHLLPYTFELEGGTFSPKSSYGAILRSSFSMVGVLKFFGLVHSPSSSSPESEPPSEVAKFDIQGSRTETQVHHSDVPENRYSVQVFLESEGERVFGWKFTVGKDLKALKSFAKRNHPNWQHKNYFKFCFTDNFLELQLEEEQCSYEGWLICPSDYPCQICQNDVDMFWKDMPPCCQVKVIAQDTPETTQHLNYPVPVKNIDSKKKIFIQCSLTESNQTYEGAAGQATVPSTSKQGTSQEAALITAEGISTLASTGSSRTLTEEDLFDVLEAVSDLNDWKRLGLALGLRYHTIKHIETDRKEKSDDCKMDMLEAWLKQQDDVSEKGVPSWSVLKTALKRMGENALAKRINTGGEKGGLGEVEAEGSRRRWGRKRRRGSKKGL